MQAWRIGDLSPSGILLTLIYAAIGLGCWQLERRSWGDRRLSEEDRERRAVWIMLAVLFAAITIERQIGLFDRITEVMREDAVIEGSYGGRRVVQAHTLKWFGLGALIAAPVLAFLAARAGRWAAFLTAVATVIVTLRVAKAISLHAVDALFNKHILWVALGNWAELVLAGLGVTAVLMERARRETQRRQHRASKRRRPRKGSSRA